MLLNALMRALSIVVINIGSHHLAQVSFIEDDNFIKTFVANGSNPAFSEGVGIRGLARRFDHLDALRAKHSVKRATDAPVV